MPTPKDQPSKDGFAVGQAVFGAGAVKPSKVQTLDEAEAMLLAKEERLGKADANQLAAEGRDLNELIQRNKLQLELVRKEKQRLSK